MRNITTASLLSLALALGCFGQGETLLLGPGDLVHVQVFDTPEMDQHVRVTDAGTVPLAFIGALKISGATPADAAHAIQQALVQKQFMLHPQVSVTVEQFATQNVSVVGQVRNPGAFPLATAQPLLKVLSLAGGLTDVADRHITIERQNEPATKVQYYFSNASDQAINNEVLVRPGDTVVVPKAGVVYVLGDVAHPGGYPMATNDTKLSVLQAMAIAGSANKTSMKSKVRLIRNTPQGQSDTTLQLAAIEKGDLPDPQLQPDDILYIPFSWMKNIAVSGSSIAGQTGAAAIYLAR